VSASIWLRKRRAGACRDLEMSLRDARVPALSSQMGRACPRPKRKRLWANEATEATEGRRPRCIITRSLVIRTASSSCRLEREAGSRLHGPVSPLHGDSRCHRLECSSRNRIVLARSHCCQLSQLLLQLRHLRLEVDHFCVLPSVQLVLLRDECLQLRYPLVLLRQLQPPHIQRRS
jgi:hypothetical protein